MMLPGEKLQLILQEQLFDKYLIRVPVNLIPPNSDTHSTRI